MSDAAGGERDPVADEITQVAFSAYMLGAQSNEPDDVVVPLRRMAEECAARLREPREKSPCEDALDLLWRDIILARNPKYGDWEYPGMAYRHLLAEFTELRASRDALATMQRGADRLALAVMDAIERRTLGVRSETGDALTDYADQRFDVRDGSGISRLRELERGSK